MKKGAAILLGMFILIGCSGRQPAIALPTAPTPEPIPSETSGLTATSTTLGDWLPQDPKPRLDGCDDFIATLPIDQAGGLTQEELIGQLFGIYLDRFHKPNLGSVCRLVGASVDKVTLDQRIAFLAQEQNVDEVAWVYFSVQVSSVSTNWVAANGELSADGWIRHKTLIVGV